ncbi:hypothetical protein CS298_12330, partial [Pseudomonas syringae pv. actinidiae]
HTLGPVQLTRHPCRVPPGSAPGLSRHLRRTLRRQCHRDKKAVLFTAASCSGFGQGMTLCGSTDVTSLR